MDTPQRLVSFGFTSEVFPAGTHICYLYDDDAECREIVPAFVRSGLAGGDVVSYFTDAMSPADRLSAFEAMGIDRSPDLHVERVEDVYYPTGEFDPDRMLDTLRASHASAVAAGHRGARAVGEMSWALRPIPGVERVVEYEARVNALVATHPVTALCQYDVRRFDGAMIFDIINVHPLLMMRGQVVRNPYYTTADAFVSNPRRAVGREGAGT